MEKQLWPIRPKPQDEESFSSWLARLAAAYGLDPRRICLAALGDNRWAWFTDVDRGSNRRLIEFLAEKTGIAVERVERTTLGAFDGRISERISTRSNSAWLLPLGSTKGAWYGLQYCPQCLADGDIAYFRREWRLGFVTLCLKHGRELFDRCKRCGAAANYRNAYPSTSDYSEKLLTSCHACRADYRHSYTNSIPLVPERREVEFQLKLLSIAERGWIEIPGAGPTYSHLYFIVLRRLMVLLVAGKKRDTLRRWVSRNWNTRDIGKSPRQYAGIERLDVSTRRALLGMARELLEDWPERFIDCCKANGLSRQILLDQMDYIPYWFWNVIRWHVAKPRYEATEQEIESAFRFVFQGYDQYRNARHLPENIRIVAKSLNKITSRRKIKLWKKLGIANRRLQVNRSSKTLVPGDPDKSITPTPRLIPDFLWGKVKRLIPTKQPYRRITKGLPAVDDRTILSGIIYVLATSCTWENVPSEFGTFNQVYHRYKKWKRSTQFQQVVALCLLVYRDGDRG